MLHVPMEAMQLVSEHIFFVTTNIFYELFDVVTETRPVYSPTLRIFPAYTCFVDEIVFGLSP